MKAKLSEVSMLVGEMIPFNAENDNYHATISADGRIYTFYSYKTVIGVIYKGKSIKSIVALTTNEHYSITTSRHLNLFKCGIQMLKIEFPDRALSIHSSTESQLKDFLSFYLNLLSE